MSILEDSELEPMPLPAILCRSGIDIVQTHGDELEIASMVATIGV